MVRWDSRRNQYSCPNASASTEECYLIAVDERECVREDSELRPWIPSTITRSMVDFLAVSGAVESFNLFSVSKIYGKFVRGGGGEVEMCRAENQCPVFSPGFFRFQVGFWNVLCLPTAQMCRSILIILWDILAVYLIIQILETAEIKYIYI